MADDEKTTAERPIEPTTVAVITIGDNRALESGMEAVTPGAHQPNIILQGVRPIKAITIRFVYVFLKSISGSITVGGVTGIIPFTDFQDLLAKSCGLALGAACIGLIVDLTTIFSDLEKNNPLLNV